VNILYEKYLYKQHTFEFSAAFFFLRARLPNILAMFRCIIELVVVVGVEPSEPDLETLSASSCGDGGGGKLAKSASSNSTAPGWRTTAR